MPASNTKFLDVCISERMSRQANGAIAESKLVAIDGANHTLVGEVGAANAKCDGVAESAVADGRELSIATGGRIAIVAGGTIVPGDELVSDASGRVVPKGTTATVAYQVVARALTAAALDELVMVKWGCYSVFGANAS